MKENTALRKKILAALFLAIGLILPFITMQIPAVGKMLCPMHIPVLLCGLLCGWPLGLLCGLAGPLMSSLITAMPPMAMAIWFTYWDYYTSFKRSVVRNAGNFSECLLYGV